MRTSAAATAGSQTEPGVDGAAVDPEQRRDEDLVDRRGRRASEPSMTGPGVLAGRSTTSSSCGAYQATIATTEGPRPSSHAASRRQRRTAGLRRSMRRRARSSEASTSRRRPRRTPPRPATSARCGWPRGRPRPELPWRRTRARSRAPAATGRAGAARRVAKKRKRTPDERRDARVQPRRHERDAEEERNDRPEPQGDLGLPDDGARRPAEQAEELVVVRDVGARQDLARARARRSPRR